MANQSRTYKYTSTKEYHDAFPCAYRQWRADSHCNTIHGYSFSMNYVNGVYIPDYWGSGEAQRLWCYRVEVRETQSNMAFREGHREWNEDLFA